MRDRGAISRLASLPGIFRIRSNQIYFPGNASFVPKFRVKDIVSFISLLKWLSRAGQTIPSILPTERNYVSVRRPLIFTAIDIKQVLEKEHTDVLL